MMCFMFYGQIRDVAFSEVVGCSIQIGSELNA